MTEEEMAMKNRV